MTVKAGERIELDAAGSHDPSGDEIHFNWFQYAEADSYPGSVHIENASSPKQVLDVPSDAAGTNIHIVLEVKDHGSPELVSYRRVILQVTS